MNFMIMGVDPLLFVEEPGLPSAGQDTLESLDWCLYQLEQFQTNKSPAGLAADKFKRMLNEELSSFSRSGSTGMTISRHITDTYYGPRLVSTLSES